MKIKIKTILLILVSAQLASAVTFTGTGTYDENLIEPNIVDAQAPGSAPLGTFTANLASAFAAQGGAVVNFDEIQSFTFTAFDVTSQNNNLLRTVTTFNSNIFGLGGGPSTWFTGQGGGWVPISGLPNNPPFTGTEYLAGTGPNANYYNFDFSSPVQAVGVSVLGNPAPVTVDFYAFDTNGALLQHLTDSVGNAVNDDTFFAFDSGISNIEYVSVISNAPIRLDDLAFHGTPVPEPGVPAMMLFGFAVLCVLRKKIAALAAVAVIGTMAATGAQAAVNAYGIDGVGDLRQIDLLTMQSTVLGSTGRTGPVNVGLAIDPAGQLYLGDGTGGIFSLAYNGTATPIGNPLQGPITGLDWDPITNDLLVVTSGAKMFHADPLTGNVIGPIVTALVGGGQIESIAFVSSVSGLITFGFGGNSEVSLISLNTGSLFGTPAFSNPGEYWTGVDVDQASAAAYMIGFPDDSWQVTNNAGTLTAAHLAANTHLDWTALAIPVPEPGTGVLVLLGAAVAAVLGRRRIG